MASKPKPYSENELIDKFRQFCSDFKVGVQDIKNPVPEFVREMYRRILIEFNVDITSLRQPHFYQMEALASYAEMYQDVIPVINLMQAVRYFGVLPDFGILDIVSPGPKRNLQQMSMFMQFVEFCDVKLSELSDKLESVNEKKARKKLLLQKIDELKNRKNDRIVQRSNMMEEKTELERIYHALTQDQKAVLNEKDIISNEMDYVKTNLNERNRRVEKLQQNLDEVEEEIQRVKSLIVVSPTSIVTDLDALRRKKEENHESLKNLKDKLQSKKQLSAQLNEEEKKQVERTLHLTELIKLIENTQAEKKAVEMNKNTLSELTAKLEEEVEGTKKTQMKVEALKKELFDLQSQWKKEKDELEKNLETCKREVKELELKKETALQLASSLENIESVINEKTQEFYKRDDKRKLDDLIAEDTQRNEDIIKALKINENHLVELMNLKKGLN